MSGGVESKALKRYDHVIILLIAHEILIADELEPTEVKQIGFINK